MKKVTWCICVNWCWSLPMNAKTVFKKKKALLFLHVAAFSKMPFHFLTFFCFAHPLSVTQARVLFTSGQPHVTAVESLCYFLLLIHFPLLYFLFSSLDMITHILTLKHTCTYDCMWNGLSITQLKCFRDAKMVTLRTFGLNDLENLQRHVALEMVVVNSNLTLFCSKDYNIVYAKKKKKKPYKKSAAAKAGLYGRFITSFDFGHKPYLLRLSFVLSL